MVAKQGMQIRINPKAIISILFISLLTSCQLKPTKVSETAELNPQLLLEQASGPIQLDEKTIVVDARSAFEYSVAHVPGSIYFSWENFAQPSGRFIGKVNGDLPMLAKRLALLGLNPQTPVIVVGKGKQGQGEEGRVAWSLLHLGFSNVQMAGIGYFKTGLNNAEPAPRANAPVWQPQPQEKLEAQKKEVLAIATQVLKEGERPNAHLLDVRTRKEYFKKKSAHYASPDLKALHIPWTQFYTDDGRPNIEMRQQILALGWQPQDRIVVISDHGKRSGAVAFILTKLGFTNVANYTGGYAELSAKN